MVKHRKLISEEETDQWRGNWKKCQYLYYEKICWPMNLIIKQHFENVNSLLQAYNKKWNLDWLHVSSGPPCLLTPVYFLRPSCGLCFCLYYYWIHYDSKGQHISFFYDRKQPQSFHKWVLAWMLVSYLPWLPFKQRHSLVPLMDIVWVLSQQHTSDSKR